MNKKLLAALFSLACAVPLFAHDPGLSTATVRILGDQLEATVTMSIKDANELIASRQNQRSEKQSPGSTPQPSTMNTLAGEALVFSTDNQSVHATETRHTLDDQGNATFFIKVPLTRFSKLEIHSPLLAKLPPGHRQFLSVRDASDRPLSEQLLSASAPSTIITQDPSHAGHTGSHPSESATGFFTLGVKHILMGFDHLLFLFCLLVVTSKFSSALKIITSFTVAHSITLALAALGTINLPGRLVEPLIAASIVYVAIENIWRGEAARGRVWLTFGFGLIHGLGFASALRELGVGSSGNGVFRPLLSFNLGVEFGQVLIAAAVLPILWKIGQHPNIARHWVPASSTLVGLAGLFWLLERTVFG